EVVPRGATRAVVLAHRPPLPGRQVGAPPLPPRGAYSIVVEPLLLRVPPHRGTVCPTGSADGCVPGFEGGALPFPRQDRQRGRTQHQVPAEGGIGAEPARREHPQEVPMREDEDVAVGG